MAHTADIVPFSPAWTRTLDEMIRRLARARSRCRRCHTLLHVDLEMALRTVRIAAGGSAGAAEAELMVTEKVCAAIELQTRLMTGALGHTPLSGAQGTLKHYRRKVAANSKRLSCRSETSG